MKTAKFGKRAYHLLRCRLPRQSATTRSINKNASSLPRASDECVARGSCRRLTMFEVEFSCSYFSNMTMPLREDFRSVGLERSNLTIVRAARKARKLKESESVSESGYQSWK